MSLVADAHKSLIKTALRGASNAFIAHLPTDRAGQDRVGEQVERAQRRVELSDTHNAPKSALDGQVVAIKDNISTLAFPTTCASGILHGFQSPTNSTVVKALEDGGMLVMGKTNLDEFAMGSHSTHSAVGAVRNNAVRGFARSAGGSSGGSAMAVLTGQCRVALGTDTGGSVRLPAAYTGLLGFKPSYGRLSRYGVVPYANSLDTVGIIGRRCSDVLNVFRHLDKPDPSDPTCINQTTRQRLQGVKTTHEDKPRKTFSPPVTSMSPTEPAREYPQQVIGVPYEYNIQEMADSVRGSWNRTLAVLESQGHIIVPISLPHTKAALSAYYVLAPAEASSNLAKYDGVRYGASPDSQSASTSATTTTTTANNVLYSTHRRTHFGPEVRRRILLGTYTLSSTAKENHFIQAQRIRRLVQQDFDRVFKRRNPLHRRTEPPANGVDWIICPTTPTPPPILTHAKQSYPPETYMNDVFTVPASLAGLPALSVPAALGPQSRAVEYRNVGMQVVGQYGSDEALVRFVQAEMEPGEEEVEHYAAWRKKKYL